MFNENSSFRNLTIPDLIREAEKNIASGKNGGGASCLKEALSCLERANQFSLKSFRAADPNDKKRIRSIERLRESISALKKEAEDLVSGR